MIYVIRPWSLGFDNVIFELYSKIAEIVDFGS